MQDNEPEFIEAVHLIAVDNAVEGGGQEVEPADLDNAWGLKILVLGIPGLGQKAHANNGQSIGSSHYFCPSLSKGSEFPILLKEGFDHARRSSIPALALAAAIRARAAARSRFRVLDRS